MTSIEVFFSTIFKFVPYYHTNGLKTLEQFKRDVENIKEEQSLAGEPPAESKIVYLHWGDDCWDVDEDKTRTAYVDQKCERMGTDPEWIIKHLQKKYVLHESDRIKLLYIITDGLICKESAEKCFKFNEFMQYDRVVFHALNEQTANIDFSVAASFFKSRCMVYRNYKLLVSTDISKEFDYDKIDIHNFTAKKDQLKSHITLKYIRQFNRDAESLQEIHKLKVMRERLFDRINSERSALSDSDRNNKLMLTYIVMKVDIERSISSLITYIMSNVRSYSFDALTFDMEADEGFEDELTDDADYTTEQEFEIFDFSLEDDVGIPGSCANGRMESVTFSEVNLAARANTLSANKTPSDININIDCYT
ncbi:hypothetical protein KGM_210247 [Danaus plexippus plexippus]|uniref:Uncharacterized protein n=1 Tax=Danaus plexippus plexippus TaxID=278856 RepID=A0A212EUX2_DANPL|nr:hypothetical protein KGM_210247 [Danaus plexippus plexippus]